MTAEQREQYVQQFSEIDVNNYGVVSAEQIAAYDKQLSSDSAYLTGDSGTTDDSRVRLLDPAAGNSPSPAAGSSDGMMDLDAFVEHRWKSRTKRPSLFLVHGSLVLVQIIFGVGSVIGKLGVSSFNPVLFALIREAAAGPILLAMALVLEGCVVKFCNRLTWRFAAGGVFLFLNQLCFIVGEKLSSAVIGSAWQPSQAIFTVILTLILCMEKATVLKIGGVLVACGGAVFMVVWGADESTITGGQNAVLGNILFAVNCLGTSLYVIVTKPLLRRYPPLSVTGWCYICASVGMVRPHTFVPFSLTTSNCPCCTMTSLSVFSSLRRAGNQCCRHQLDPRSYASHLSSGQ